MPELITDRKIFSLLEVATSIQKTLSARYTSSFWVKAEMNKLNLYQRSCHCYPDLVEKRGNNTIAQLRAILWKDDYIFINNKFMEILKEPLKDGIKILFLCKITFTPFHGLALQIIDIDPGYTLGDLEKEKLDTINALKSKGIYDKNKSLLLPLLPQRIAVISVESSKGYADFLSVLNDNSWGYKFFFFLFPSLLQGDKAVDGLIWQLKRIKKVKDHFDIVAIIRGGGGDIGLSCYNNSKLAEEIALFPLPVFTGIGHATNETVAEMISFTNAITPTKLAESLLQKFHDFSVPVQRAEEKIVDKAIRLIAEESKKFEAEVKYFRSLTGSILHAGKMQLTQYDEKLQERCTSFMKNKNRELLQAEKNVNLLDPINVLKRGFSISRHNGKAIRHAREMDSGAEMETELFEGKLQSIIQSTK